MNKINLCIAGLIMAAIAALSCSRHSASLPTWLQGTWETGDSVGLVTEHWEVIDNDFMSGEGLFINREGKTVVELLNLFIKDGALVYTAMLPNQNNGEEIIFLAGKSKPDSLVFENHAHDYPKKIIYHHTENDLVNVYIHGGKTDPVNLIRLKRAAQ